MKKINTEPRISRYLHSVGREKGLPISGTFEITSRCNFNCPMCYVHLSDEDVEQLGPELTAQQWLEIAKDAKDRGMVFALLTGGEPLIRKDFFEIYQGMKDMGLVVSINTNGSMIHGEILEKFLENPPFRFNISLYGGCNETYENMCGQPMYEQVKENIRKLKKAGVDVCLNLSITPYNRQDLQKIYEDAVELDVNVRASSYMYPPIRVNGEQYGINDRFTACESAAVNIEWDRIRMSAEEFYIRAENLLKYQMPSDDGCSIEIEEGVRCRAGSSSFWMTWDGEMRPCGMMTMPTAYPLKDGFEKAWNEIREKTSEIKTPSKCSACSYKEICGTCAAVCLTETGSFDKVPEYMCQRTEGIIAETKKAAKI